MVKANVKRSMSTIGLPMETTDPYRMKTASSHDNQPEFRWKCEWEWRQSIALANWAAKTLGGSGGVIDLRDPARRDKLLIITEVDKVRGVSAGG